MRSIDSGRDLVETVRRNVTIDWKTAMSITPSSAHSWSSRTRHISAARNCY